jgi:hypothetical protein
MMGHTAFEYLMTYGWVIIIALIVTGVMTYYGIFSPSGSFLSVTVKGFGQVQVMSPWNIDASSGDVRLNLQNRLDGDITIIGANVTIENTPIAYAASKIIHSGTSDLTLFTPNLWTSQEKGAQYTANVKIIYIYQGSIFSSSGEVSGTYS